MLLSELIAEAQKELAEHGDTDVLDMDWYPVRVICYQVTTPEQAAEWGSKEGEPYYHLISDK